MDAGAGPEVGQRADVNEGAPHGSTACGTLFADLRRSPPPLAMRHQSRYWRRCRRLCLLARPLGARFETCQKSALPKSPTRAVAEILSMATLLLTAFLATATAMELSTQHLLEPFIAVSTTNATACPHGCSGHGKCVDGECKCFAGFTYYDCSLRVCPNSCSGNGFCYNATCHCHPGWRGADCSAQVVPQRVQLPRRLQGGQMRLPRRVEGRGLLDARVPERLLRPRRLRELQVQVPARLHRLRLRRARVPARLRLARHVF